MLRITRVTESQAEVVLRIEGWVSGSEVAVLAAEGRDGLARARRLVLDLRGVRFIDADGLELLQSWKGPRLVLRNASIYLRMVLEDMELDD